MKNEGIIMEKGEFMNIGVTPEVKNSSQESAKKLTVKESPLQQGVNRGGKISSRMQAPENLKDNTVEQKDQRKSIDLMPETEEKLKKFSAEIEIDGRKEPKTAADVVKDMNVLLKKELPAEQRNKALLRSVVLMDKLTQKYENKPEERRELHDALFNEVFAGGDKNKGQKTYEWFQDQVKVIGEGEKMQIDVNGLADIIGLKLDEKKMGELGQLIKLLPAPGEGSDGIGGGGSASKVTVGEDGRVTVTPAPGEGKGISKTPDNSGGQTPDVHAGTGEEEKKRLKWEKYGYPLLFLLILYIGLQGWAAKMAEQMAERAR